MSLWTWTMDDPNALSYEAAYEELVELIDRLESGNLALEEALALYERGRALAARCQRLLDEAELRLQRLESG
ncbi:MAG: exodeoxyribonuclease VII small subunit [Anaerolineae bacterium]|nr:exodeoxyribonuclease VII small subunit [Anaerolineae bacterium]